MCLINKYITREEILVQINDQCPPPIADRFIGVKEIFRTCTFVDICTDSLVGIIFVFHVDQFRGGPYEGTSNIFCIRFKIDADQKITEIPADKCLAFPCSYKQDFPCLYKSYAYRIHQVIQKIKNCITKLMCRNTQSIGSTYIVGGTSFDCPIEFWAYLKSMCPDVEIHGPFVRRHKKINMRSLLDLSANSNVSSSETIRFCSTTHFRRFDTIFGKFTRFGTSEPRPNVGESTILRRDHHAFTWGEGIADEEVGPFQRRGFTGNGLDFSYNLTTTKLTIKIRYKKVRVDYDEELTSFCVARDHHISNLSRNSRNQASLVDNVATNYRTLIRSGAEFVFQGTSYSVISNFTENMLTDGVLCEVVEESDNGPDVGSTHAFDIKQAHDLILNLLRNI